MEMNSQIVLWLLFLASIINVICSEKILFEMTNRSLTAKEGSCIKINCRVTDVVSDSNAYWFWMKDAQWVEANKSYIATVIYSTDTVKRPVSPDYAGRVKYDGSPSSSWNLKKKNPPPYCSILICNLNKNDSGNYSFRFIGPKNLKWFTKDSTNLTVTENPCPITFDQQPISPVMKENDTTTLTCSTLSSCPSNIMIKDQPSAKPELNKTHKSISVNFTTTWQDDGRVFTCEEEDSTEKSLSRNISMSVEYGPRDISATVSSENIKENDSVTLTCSAKGNPNSTFIWFKDGGTTVSQDVWQISSITASQNGTYYCQAKNKYGQIKSKPVTIDVKIVPEVEIRMTPSDRNIREGDTVNLTCHVKRSNPTPGTYTWLKDEKVIGTAQTFTKEMFYEDKGSYKCTATNNVDTGTSNLVDIVVEYLPRNTNIITDQDKEQVKAGSFLRFTCKTDANPDTTIFSWYRYNEKPTIPLVWTSKTTEGNILNLNIVQRSDEACYMCNATNSLGTGQNSNELCIKVVYPPTVPELSIDSQVTENQTINIICTVESYPTSTLTLTRQPKPDTLGIQLKTIDSNKLQHSITVASKDTGYYTCNAKNNQGSEKSSQKQLVVKYTPENVKIQTPSNVVENQTLTLQCSATSYPQVHSFIWIKKGEIIPNEKQRYFIAKSVSSSDSGIYSCAAVNEIGTGYSEGVLVRVQYGPKETKLIPSTEVVGPDRKTFIKLNCEAECDPPVHKYLWYKEEKGKSLLQMKEGQSFTVYSDQPGVYYCVAINTIDKRESKRFHVFDGSFMKMLILSICLILILLVVIIVVVYRYRKNSLAQQGLSPLCLSFLGWTNSARRGPMTHGTLLAEPSRSRDDLLPDRSSRPEAPRCRPALDSTPAADVRTVYSMVKLPHRKQAPAEQKPSRAQGGHAADDFQNHASLHFGDKKNNKQLKAEEDAVYAKVCKSNPKNKNENEWMADYENISATPAAQPPKHSDDDTDSSDEEVQLNYTQVSFTANSRQQRSDSSSTSSDDYETQYSDVKM